MAEVKINTPKELPKFKALEQRADYIRSRAEYSNGLILITELNANGETYLHSNYNWIQNADGSLTPDYRSLNPNFVDEN